MTLDDRLDCGFDTVHEERQPDSIKIRWYLGEESISKAKQAILSDLLEMIGLPEDALPINQLSDEDLVIQLKENATNILRQELREKVKKYCD